MKKDMITSPSKNVRLRVAKTIPADPREWNPKSESKYYKWLNYIKKMNYEIFRNTPVI